MKTINNSHGFSVLPVLLFLIILGIIGFTGWFLYSVKNDSNETYDKAAQSSNETPEIKDTKDVTPVSYLSIPEAGVKIPLTEDTKDAYYKVIDGYIYLSVHRFDGMEEGACSAGDSGLGVMALLEEEVGKPNENAFDGSIWTEEELQESGLKKIGNKYYGFMRGNAACYDVDDSKQVELFNSVVDGFTAQKESIVVL